MDEHFLPVIADARAAEGVDAVRAQAVGGAVGIGDFEGNVVEAGAALSQELGDEAVFAERLEDLPLHLALAVGAGDIEDDAGEASIVAAETTSLLPAEDVAE